MSSLRRNDNSGLDLATVERPILPAKGWSAEAFPGAAPESMRHWMELVFLSGTNFSATGLSDIVPGTPHARMLLLIEQWNGVMYLAIVVARLAGMLKPTPARKE